MNTLEDMIRRATQATADEVDPGSLPAPRLPVLERRARSRHASSHASHPAIRRWGAPLAAATAVIAVAAVSAVAFSGSGKAPASHRTAPSAREAVRRTPGQIASENSEVIGLFMPATGAQHTAGSQLWGLMYNLRYDATARCMAAQGFTTRVGNMSPALWATVQEGTDLTDPDLARMAGDGSLAPIVTYPSAPNGSKRFQAHENSCFNTTGRAYTPLWNAGDAQDFFNWPTPAELRAIHDSAPEQAALPSLQACAVSHGAPAGPLSSAYQSFTSWILNQLKVQGQVGGVSSSVLNQRSRHLEPIFVTCAGPYVRVQDRMELALQQAFLRQHQQQIQALEALTHRIIAEQQMLDGMRVTW
jgi:hypothetical protein